MYLATLLVLIGTMKLLNKEERIFKHINLLFSLYLAQCKWKREGQDKDTEFVFISLL